MNYEQADKMNATLKRIECLLERIAEVLEHQEAGKD